MFGSGCGDSYPSPYLGELVSRFGLQGVWDILGHYDPHGFRNEERNLEEPD